MLLRLAASVLVLAVVLASCRAAGPCRSPSSYGNDRGEDAAAPVAAIAGRPISKGELADFWFDRYPEEYGRTLDALIDERVVAMHARREGLRVPRDALVRAVSDEVEARRKQLRQVFGDQADLDAEVRRAYGVDVTAWRNRILWPRLHAQLLMERVIRWDTRSRDRVHARVIVLHDATRAGQVVEKLRRGADFSLTALKESEDPTAKVGGELPLIGRGDTAFPGVEARLFAASAGQLIGPLEVRVDGRAQWQIYKIIERHAAWRGDPQARRARLENDLVAKPVTRAEYERWRTRVRRDADVRTYRPDGRLWRTRPR